MGSKWPTAEQDASNPEYPSHSDARKRRARSLVVIFLVTMAGLYILAISRSPAYFLMGGADPHEHEIKPWGTYSPYAPVAQYEPPPGTCRITQVNILQRHGSRYPKNGSSANIRSALEKLQVGGKHTDSSLLFLNDYQYDLDTLGLAPLGAQELQDAGQTAYERYKHLVREDNTPFVRVSDAPHVVDSATNWTAGFAAASQHKYSPSIAVFFSEEPSANSTLDRHLCPAAGNADPQTTVWESIFAPPIRERLSSLLLSTEQVSSIQGLTDHEIYILMKICPFENAVYRKSPFCDLFADDYVHFDYWEDLDRYYSTGYGQQLGPVQGVGYVNELIARLTASPVRDNTQTNRTLDSDPLTFPLDRTVYADFSHRSQLTAIYSTLGLFKPPSHLNPMEIEEESEWKASRMVPFAGRMVVEKLDCRGEEKIRILVNDRVMPLEACGAVDGVCDLGAFVESQAYARHDGNGDFEKCFELD